MSQHLRRLLQYDAWANRETVESLQGRPPERSLRWMAHIVGAEYLWLARLKGESAPLAVWPELGIDACHDKVTDLARLWPEFLEAHRDSLGDTVSYTNTKGEAWTNTVEEILTHVPVHSAYHRGQIASDVRGAGMTPALTDYIHAVRRGFVQ
jgi:uncharacterized damage-inducible protein DinB